MMKKLLFVSMFLVVSLWSIGQTGWIKVGSGLATGRGVGQVSIGMNDPTALYCMAVDGTGAIVDAYTKSTNSGTSWTAGTFNAGTGLSQVFAFSADTAWALFNTGASQGCYKTVNGGTTWAKKGTAFGSTSFADCFHFFNTHDGVAIGDPIGGYFEIYTTTDGGETWTRVPQANIPAPVSGEYGITADIAAFGDNVWFGTNKGNIFHSSNKGLNWTASLTTFGAAETVAPEFVSATHGIAFRSYLDLGRIPEINVTTDGGATWSSVMVTGDCYGRYFSHIPGSTGTYIGSSVTVGDNGISASYDGGNTWTVISAGFDFAATAWINDSTGWSGSLVTAATDGMYIYDGPPLSPALPVANFTANPTSVILGGAVAFTDASSGGVTSWAWVFPGGTPASSTAQNPTVHYNTHGTYDVTLTVTNPNGTNAKTKTAYIYVGGVGVDELSATSISVYPNPVKDVLTIEGGSSIQKIQIYNTTGQLVLNQQTDSKTVTLNTSSLRSGIYFLKVTTANGTTDRKITVQ